MFIAILLRKSKDAFYIRQEIIGMAVMYVCFYYFKHEITVNRWAIATPPAVAYSIIPTNLYFPPSMVITIVLMVSFIMYACSPLYHSLIAFRTLVFPLYLAFKEETSRKVANLSSPPFGY